MVDTVGVTHDVVLAGKGYQLKAGGYKRVEAGRAGAEKGREAVYRQTGWGGPRERGAFDGRSIWTAEGFTQVEGGAGLQLLPAGVWDTALGGAGSAYGGGADWRGNCYVAVDLDLLKVVKYTTGAPDLIGTYQSLSLFHTAFAPIKQVFVYRDKLYITEGGASYERYDGAAWSVPAFSADLLCAYAGVLLRAYNGALFWSVDETAWTQIPFYELITAFLPYDDSLLIGTTRGLWRLTARLAPKDPAAAPTVYDYFDWRLEALFPVSGLAGVQTFKDMQVYNGRVYFYDSGSLWSWGGGSVRREPVYGSFGGMAQVGLFLVASIQVSESGRALWLKDGEMWTKLAAATEAGDQYAQPIATGAVLKTQLLAWGAGTRGLARWNFASTSRVWETGHATARVQLPEIGGEEPEVERELVEVGLELGAVEGAAALAASPATWWLETSEDGGATWTTRLSHTPSSLYSSAAAAVAGVTVKRLWLRVRVTGGGGANPALRSVWARLRSGVSSGRGRRWELVIDASDQVVQHDGARDSQSGRELAAGLLALVGGGAVGFDDRRVGESYTVAVVEVAETIEKNTESWAGESTVKVALEEV